MLKELAVHGALQLLLADLPRLLASKSGTSRVAELCVMMVGGEGACACGSTLAAPAAPHQRPPLCTGRAQHPRSPTLAPHAGHEGDGVPRVAQGRELPAAPVPCAGAGSGQVQLQRAGGGPAAGRRAPPRAPGRPRAQGGPHGGGQLRQQPAGARPRLAELPAGGAIWARGALHRAALRPCASSQPPSSLRHVAPGAPPGLQRPQACPPPHPLPPRPPTRPRPCASSRASAGPRPRSTTRRRAGRAARSRTWQTWWPAPPAGPPCHRACLACRLAWPAPHPRGACCQGTQPAPAPPTASPRGCSPEPAATPPPQVAGLAAAMPKTCCGYASLLSQYMACGTAYNIRSAALACSVLPTLLLGSAIAAACPAGVTTPSHALSRCCLRRLPLQCAAAHPARAHTPPPRITAAFHHRRPAGARW
jgi:hypothetical protein